MSKRTKKFIIGVIGSVIGTLIGMTIYRRLRK